MEKVTGVFSRFLKNLEKTPVTFSISHPLQVNRTLMKGNENALLARGV